MKEGAAPMTPLDETPLEKRPRKHRTKGDAPQRSSRRRRGVEPPILDEVPPTAAVKKLQSGGAGGRVREQSNSVHKWAFPNVSLTKNEQNDNAPDNAPETKFETYRIVDLTAIEDTMNTMLSCSCEQNEEIDSFVHFCLENDSGLCETTLKNLAQRWKT